MELILQALASPFRRRILELLHERELSAGELASHFLWVSRAACSQQISLLKKAELLRERRAGTRRFYKTRPDRLIQVDIFIRRFFDPPKPYIPPEELERRKAAIENYKPPSKKRRYR
jgi:DNA-binding transcriptional ArsR family regulator